MFIVFPHIVGVTDEITALKSQIILFDDTIYFKTPSQDIKYIYM